MKTGKVVYYFTHGYGKAFDYPVEGSPEQIDQIREVLSRLASPPKPWNDAHSGVGLRPEEILQADKGLEAVKRYEETENRAQGLHELPDELKEIPFLVHHLRFRDDR